MDKRITVALTMMYRSGTGNPHSHGTPVDVVPTTAGIPSTLNPLPQQWRNILTGGPWTNYIKGPIPHSEFTEEFIIIKILTKITIKHKTMMKWEMISNFAIKAELSV